MSKHSETLNKLREMTKLFAETTERLREQSNKVAALFAELESELTDEVCDECGGELVPFAERVKGGTKVGVLCLLCGKKVDGETHTAD